MPPPLHPYLIAIFSSRQNDEDPVNTAMSGITSGVIIGISVGAALLVLVVLSLIFYCYCYSASRGNSAETLYYKFDYNSSSLASIQSDPNTSRKSNTPSTVDNVSRQPSGVYFSETFSEPFDINTPTTPRNTSKNRNRSGRSIPCYASMDDGISAPRTLESEVPSSKVAFLDDHGRPITTPL